MMLAQRLILFASVLAASAAMAAGPEAGRFPGSEWDYVDPAQAGWSVDGLAQARAWSQTIRSSAVVVVQHGDVIAEWGDTQKRMELASVRKSLLSALIGNAVERKQIDLSTPIGKLGIDDNAPSLTPEEKSATIGDLLKARSGIYHPALYETREMAASRPPRGSHPPGTFWYYNNWDFNALGAIYLQATGWSVFDALDREIAKPIGMQDYRPSDGVYFTGKDSVYPAYPIRMSARDLARFALLYLREGRWRDRQIVPAQWVRESTQPFSETGFGPGYGYLWWIGFLSANSAGALAPASVTLPAGSFYAAGDAGQYAFVIPAADLVVVHRVDRDIAGYHPVGLREMGRLLWLLLAAAHHPDIGPDVSLAAAKGTRLDDAGLKAALSGATLVPADPPHGLQVQVKIGADGDYLVTGGARPTPAGRWEISDGKFCRTLGVDRRCVTVVADGPHLQMFDGGGLLIFDLRRLPAEH